MPQPGASWEDHLVRILSESLPNGASRERSIPQPDAPWEDYLVRILEESLPDGVPRVIQQIQKFQKTQHKKQQRITFPNLSKSSLLVRVLYQMRVLILQNT